MKFLPCELIRDILPLYHDGVCSDTSRKLVDSHLETCEGCREALMTLSADMEMPKLDADEGKPLKTIKRKWRKKTWVMSILIALVLVVSWIQLTQTSSVPIEAEAYEITKVIQFDNGMYYLEYRIPYDYSGIGADLLRDENGAVYLQEYRPILARKDEEEGIVRDHIIDPENHRTDTGTEMPMTAFYLGLPGDEDAVLLWSAEETYPKATAEEEREHLYQHIFR